MEEKSKYYDIRSDFWKTHFEEASSLEEYLSYTEPVYAAKWRAAQEALPAMTGDQKRRVSGNERTLNILVYSSAWCGDCSRQAPMIEKIKDTAGEKIKVRYIDREESESLKDELRILGAMRVPVVVFLSEDYHEIGRVGDRLLTAYKRKLRNEVGDACETGIVLPSKEELALEQADWIDVFERMLIMTRLAPPLRDRHDD